MKPLKKSTLTLALTLTLGLPLASNAGDVLRSPRDAGSQHRRTTVSAANDPDLLHPYTGSYVLSPRFIDNRPTMALSPDRPDPNVTGTPRPAFAPKDPRFETAWRNSAAHNLQVAPLK
jgi:hypothetical protein